MIPFAVPVTILRANGPIVRVKGETQPPVYTEITIQGSIQPMSYKDLRLLPEGRADAGLMVLFTESALYIPYEGAPHVPDRVVHGGYEWEVTKEEAWDVFFPHHKYTIERRGLRA